MYRPSSLKDMNVVVTDLPFTQSDDGMKRDWSVFL